MQNHILGSCIASSLTLHLGILGALFYAQIPSGFSFFSTQSIPVDWITIASENGIPKGDSGIAGNGQGNTEENGQGNVFKHLQEKDFQSSLFGSPSTSLDQSNPELDFDPIYLNSSLKDPVGQDQNNLEQNSPEQNSPEQNNLEQNNLENRSLEAHSQWEQSNFSPSVSAPSDVLFQVSDQGDSHSPSNRPSGGSEKTGRGELGGKPGGAQGSHSSGSTGGSYSGGASDGSSGNGQRSGSGSPAGRPASSATPIPTPISTPISTPVPTPVPTPPPAPEVFACVACPRPTYPQAARLSAHSGSVQIIVDVDPSGSVLSAALGASSGSPDLDQAALDTVQTWQFTPTMDGRWGVPVYVDFELVE